MAGPKTFTQTITEIDYGTVADELTEKLRELINATNSPGKVGELTFKIKMKGKNAGRVELSHDIALKLPKVARESSIMFTTVEGNLQARDPNQRELEGMQVVKTGNSGASVAVDTSDDKSGAVPVVLANGTHNMVSIG